MSEQSITGEISLLWQDVDPYDGDVLLMSLDTDEPMRINTFEIRGPLAVRLKDGAIEEGMRVRRGQVLARLDDSIVRASHALAEAPPQQPHQFP